MTVSTISAVKTMLDFITEKQSSWDFLKNTELPVFIYGMGDGALKIMSAFEKYGIPVAGFFASDEFVRGHYFEGHLVHKLSHIEDLIDDFVVVLAFAAGYKSLYDRIFEISEKHILLAPDVPVIPDGSGELFTYEYCLRHADEIQSVYDMLADDMSRKVFADVINFKISGKIDYLDRCTTDRGEIYRDILKLHEDSVFVDLGAYDGDTVLDFAFAASDGYKKIYALEPDKRNFRKLTKNTSDMANICTFNAAAWSESTTLRFMQKAGRQSAAARLHDIAENGVETAALAVDDIVPEGEKHVIIKLDTEGSEAEALNGAARTIAEGAELECALYHKNEDMFSLPLLVHKLDPKLKLYIRHHLYLPAWETNLYAAYPEK